MKSCVKFSFLHSLLKTCLGMPMAGCSSQWLLFSLERAPNIYCRALLLSLGLQSLPLSWRSAFAFQGCALEPLVAGIGALADKVDPKGRAVWGHLPSCSCHYPAGCQGRTSEQGGFGGLRAGSGGGGSGWGIWQCVMVGKGWPGPVGYGRLSCTGGQVQVERMSRSWVEGPW